MRLFRSLALAAFAFVGCRAPEHPAAAARALDAFSFRVPTGFHDISNESYLSPDSKRSLSMQRLVVSMGVDPGVPLPCSAKNPNPYGTMVERGVGATTVRLCETQNTAYGRPRRQYWALVRLDDERLLDLVVSSDPDDEGARTMIEEIVLGVAPRGATPARPLPPGFVRRSWNDVDLALPEWAEGRSPIHLQGATRDRNVWLRVSREASRSLEARADEEIARERLGPAVTVERERLTIDGVPAIAMRFRARMPGSPAAEHLVALARRGRWVLRLGIDVPVGEGTTLERAFREIVPTIRVPADD